MSTRSADFLISIRNIILAQLATFVVCGSVPAFAQYMNSGHYVGANLRIGDGALGVGSEFGWTISRAYLGLEAGMNHLTLVGSQSSASLPAGVPFDRFLTVEPFAGVHLGYYVLDWLGAGIVATGSTAQYVADNNHDTITRKWFDVGLDLRFRTSEHFEFTTAFTTRPLLKFGFGYLW
jgi:hypothetical protein